MHVSVGQLLDLLLGAPVVVLGHDLWTERFDSDPDVIGRVVRVNGQSSEVIGVMPAGFHFPANSELWVALQKAHASDLRIDQPSVAVYGRLRAGGDLDLAQQDLAPVAAAIKNRVPKDVFDGRFELIPFQAGFMGDDGAQLIWTLVVAVGFVLLIACANVSNLLLARSAYRVRETTVRSALGATRGRLVAHMLAEGLVISTLATFVGLLLASIAGDGMRIAVERMFDDTPHWWAFDEMDYRVVTVAVLAAFLSTLVAGLPAAWRASRPSIDSLLRDGGRTGTGLAIGKIAWGLVVFEVALACDITIAAEGTRFGEPDTAHDDAFTAIDQISCAFNQLISQLHHPTRARAKHNPRSEYYNLDRPFLTQL